jgi:hypothetical protein
MSTPSAQLRLTLQPAPKREDLAYAHKKICWSVLSVTSNLPRRHEAGQAASSRTSCPT